MNEALLIALDALLAGVSVLAGCLCLWFWHRDRRGSAQLRLGLLGIGAAMTFGSAAIVMSRPPTHVYEVSLFIRSTAYGITTILGVAALAALYAGPGRSRVLAVIAAMLAFLVLRAALWFQTDLVLDHPVRVNEWPRWGPLGWTWVLFLLAPLVLGLLGLRRSDPLLRRLMLFIFPIAAAFAIWGLLTQHGPQAEAGYTLSIVPGTAGALVLGAARIERTSRSRQRLVERQSTLTQLGQLATHGKDVDAVRREAETQLRRHLARADAEVRVLDEAVDESVDGTVTVRGRHGGVRAVNLGGPDPGSRDFVESLLQIVAGSADRAAAEELLARVGNAAASMEPGPPHGATDRMGEQLCGAVERGEFGLRYQPIVTAVGHELVGYEALGRWSHDGVTVPADQWVPAAERSGLIEAIGSHLLVRACREQPDLGVPVSVNVSPMQLSTPQFVASVRAALGSVPPDQLVLEVTERVVVTDPSDTGANLDVLRRDGVRIALDDFGTSYSSLSMLIDLPVDILKIDRSFVQRLDSSTGRSVVEAVVTLARTLGKTTVAEGVETDLHTHLLAELGVDTVQGYAVGRPITLERIRAGRARSRPIPGR